MDRKAVIRQLSFAAYFLLAFLLFLFLLFPFDRIRDRIESEVRLRTPVEASIGSLSPRFFNRFALMDVVVSDRDGRVLFESPSVSTKVSLFNLLRGVLSLRLQTKAYGGEIIVKLRQGKDQRSFFIDASGLDIASYGLLKDLGLKISGKAGGTFESVGDTGKGRLWVKSLASRELKVMGFSVPDLDFEKGWIEGDVKGDRLTIKKLELEGKELRIRVAGDLVMRQQGTINLLVKLRPSERLAREQEGLLSLLKNRDAEGFYQFALGGTLASPMPRL